MTFQYENLGNLLGEKGYIRGPFGSALKRAELKNNGIPVYEQQHAIYGLREFRYYIDEEKHKQLKRFTVKTNDLIISCSGTVGRISVIQEKDPKGIISQALLILRPDYERISPFFLYYFLTSRQGFNELINASQGAVQLNIAPRAVVEKIPVPLPSPEEQADIVSVLTSIDDKIAINQQINQTLEAMAQACFKSWFVDFEPTRAKMAALDAGGSEEDATQAAMTAISGKSADSLATLKTTNPESYAQLHTTANLFPSRLVESELGEIPEGWESGRVEDILELAYGKALKKTVRKDGDIPVYGSGGINGSHNEALVSGPGIIIGRKGTVGSIHWENRDFFPIDTAFYIVPKSGFSLCYCYQLLKTQGLENMNTDAAVPGLNRNNVYRLEVALPSPETINAFNELVELLYDKVSVTTEQSQTLTELRDSLLPKLLSGEISVDGTSQTTEAV